MKALVAATLLFCAALGVSGASVAPRNGEGVQDAVIQGDALPSKLSEYAFFTDLQQRRPAPRVTAYRLETPLFSDHAEKERYLYLPEGSRAAYAPNAAFELPVGAALIKTFGYEENGRFRPIETRLLLHRTSGWVALPYLWDAAGNDAVLKRAGARVPVSFRAEDGVQRNISYAVPNQNQCKECHAHNREIVPIGLKARHLNHGGQLQAWLARGILDRLPSDTAALARWDDEGAPLDARARAYLDINCAHCHNPAGAASNSGLFLEWDRQDGNALGMGKRPIAAGRGSGGHAFAIAPGAADQSILIYRMESVDPGIAMPELGRATVDQQGVALLRKWINSMPAR